MLQHEHFTWHVGARTVGRHRRAGVAGGGCHAASLSRFLHPGNRTTGETILVGPRRIQLLQFQEYVPADFEYRGAAFSQGDDVRTVLDGQGLKMSPHSIAVPSEPGRRQQEFARHLLRREPVRRTRDLDRSGVLLVPALRKQTGRISLYRRKGFRESREPL